MIISKVKTKEGTEPIQAISVYEWEPRYMRFETMMQNKTKHRYAVDFATLDTETSHEGLEFGWIYQWAIKFNNEYIYGRTPEELIIFLRKCVDAYGLHKNKKIIIYIHNASYDIQYLKHYLLQYDKSMSALAVDNHTILICDIFGFRILCSYKLTNLSLNLLSMNYSKKYVKAVGEIDYNIKRYQDSELTDTDWYYMFSDVASQHDGIEGYLESQGYQKAYKAPFTSTGFVRTSCRHKSEQEHGWRKQFEKMALSYEQYNLCRQAFMGGLTIASFNYTGEIVENPGHKDFTSSYPARQMMDYFPIGKPMWWGAIKSENEFRYLLSRYCCVFLLNLKEVHIRTGITAPYIPSSKCIGLKDELKVNGKVVYASELTIAITEVDFEMIEKQYYWDEKRVSKMLIFKRGPAPEWLKSEVMKYYEGKCRLKKSDPRLYMASKALLNGVYGMSATAIIRDQYEMDKETGIIEPKAQTTEDKEKAVAKYYNSFNSFMPYQLGLYTTCWARKALIDMIEAVGYDNFIYCDTDSVFYIRTEENDKRLAEMNEDIRNRAIASGAYVDDNYLGYATDEAPIKRFKALHAKCYAMEEMSKDGQYHLNVVIAGIPKRSTEWVDGVPVTYTNAEELGSLEALEDGFVFKHCGGTRSCYIEDEPHISNINGHITSYASSVVIEPIEKEISDTMYSVGDNYSLLKLKQEVKIE